MALLLRRLAAPALALGLIVAIAVGCTSPQRRPAEPDDRVPRGGAGIADGTLPPGGDRCVAALIGRNGNPNVSGVSVGNVAYITAGHLPGTTPGMAPGDNVDQSSKLTSTHGAKEGNGPPNGLELLVDTVRQNCPHLAEIRLANDAETATEISSMAAEIAQGRSVADRISVIADWDAKTHIVGAGVGGSGSGGARNGQTGGGLPNAGGAGP